MYVIGDIGNTETKICILNNNKKLLKKKILNTNNIHPNKMLGYEMPYLRSIDINELEDFNNALRVHKKII